MNGDITEVKRGLASRAQSVAEYLLPHGRKEGNEWRVGSINGEVGKSLGVHLAGTKAGVWQDFAASEGGDLLDLWCSTKGMKLTEALEAARGWLGIERPRSFGEQRKTFVRPAKPNCAAPRGRVLDYLREDRNIPAAVIEKYKIGEQGNNIIFPFLLPDGVLAMAKFREAADGASPKPTSAGFEAILFGWQAISDDARDIVITEGEIDALSWAAYGQPAMSVPLGGGKGQSWIENEFDRVARFERIFIATDMDQPGEEAAQEIALRLGRHRCYRVRMPHKDANECLVNGIAQAVMDLAIRDAEQLDPEGLRRATDYLDDVVRLFWPSSEDHQGYTMPYGKLGQRILFRAAELSLWGGASSAGKSQILSDCAVDWVRQGSRVCISSLEMKPAQTLKRMCKQAIGVDRPTEHAIGRGLEWLDNGLLIYDRVGKAGVEGLLEVFSYARAKYGCDQFIIDSLLRLGIATDDYNGQEKALFRLVDWTLANNVHTHLVAHSRKGATGAGVPEIEDVKGAMEIGANAFNILMVWRNRKVEDDLKKAETEADKADLMAKPGVILNVAKQRNGDFEGKIGLWFDQTTYRYYDTPERGYWNRRYLEHETLAA